MIYREFLSHISHFLDGDVQAWDDPMTKQLIIEVHRDGGVASMRLDHTILATKSPMEIYQLIFDHFSEKTIEESAKFIGDGTTADERRIIEINNELDIIRGRVPTPAGYKIDISRAKVLMAELKGLMENARKT